MGMPARLWSHCVVAAVVEDVGTGDEGGTVGAQEHSRVRDLIGIGHPVKHVKPGGELVRPALRTAWLSTGDEIGRFAASLVPVTSVHTVRTMSTRSSMSAAVAAGPPVERHTNSPINAR